MKGSSKAPTSPHTESAIKVRHCENPSVEIIGDELVPSFLGEMLNALLQLQAFFWAASGPLHLQRDDRLLVQCGSHGWLRVIRVHCDRALTDGDDLVEVKATD